MTDRIVFVAPPSYADAVGRVLVDHYAEVEGLGLAEDEDAAMRFLEERAGGFVEVTIQDDEEPGEGLVALVRVLREAAADHFGVTPSFEERSRGVRVEGKVFVGLDGVVIEKTMAWRDGEPDLDVATLKASGFADEDIARIVRRFLAPARTSDLDPRP